MTQQRPAAVIVLAAGEGTRMKSATPKVMHAIGGRTLLGHVVATARELDPQRLCVVVRHQGEAVAAHAQEVDGAVEIAWQDEVKGTGRAAWCAMQALESSGVLEGPVLVLAGDVPLLDSATLGQLLEAHAAGGNAVTALTTRVEDPTGYGRIVREEGTGLLARIVEERDASQAERAITEINTSVYAFDADVLRDGLARLTDPTSGATANAQGEVYLTDVVAIARETRPVRAVETDDAISVEGVNDRVQLAALGAELNRRTLESAMREGVTVVDPGSTWIDVTVTLEADVTLLPGVQLHGVTHAEGGAVIGPDSTLTDVRVGADAHVVRSHAIGAVLEAGVSVGPFAHLRPGTVVGPGAKVGGFVETKNAVIGAGTKVPHLSYVGDVTIGESTNIGAGVIVANYDGETKNHTEIGSHAFVGSDSVLVAPLTVADGAFVAAGSVVTRDVGPGDLAVARGQQRSIPGWVQRRRPQSASARAARDAAATAQAPPAQPAETDPTTEPQA
ncbi:bifunctional UDP-N-acetylglucosamine diphosphorylase/glucosamine-1-phosphate N-acetyltransferase GlmU [Serinibacter salmoneus]|uniref:Bifunctional protein GlmU n=1 Tax=Serinibacter salmoneus TaxID=556530 RepID=A0A2A9D197_9MICO|nr:bifunctional UDP-N-acetylglucosamine diphosphorylase/glucosamine-1-phosphate N-acetyltransferase GlmU [Serinibacter salmoneus]PFG20478.1 bifunctional UDP-N-acetylglucosamine pyrophosphorylase/glucosamine-1-phosphate N-acetyltransferase [Serinibacter salmoneus]